MWFKKRSKQNRIKMKKIFAITSLLALSSMAVFAQDKKLKDVQEASLWAPAGVKADGKLTEWNDSFQALNKATKLYYTIANDEKNLYLVFKSTDMTTNNKVAAGGITIAVNTDGKKKTENAYSMTYPVVVRNFGRGQRPGGAGGAGGITVVNGGNMRGMMGGSQAEMDSAMLAMRKQTLAQAKEIKVAGFKDIPDSLISLYNEHGVKAMANYDASGNFLYEVAIPLKLMGLTTASTNEIAYNVRVNGLQIPGFNAADMSIGGGMGGMGGGMGGGGAEGAGAPRVATMRMNGGFAGGNGSSPRRGGFDIQEMMSPSDFWGKYTLAKK